MIEKKELRKQILVKRDALTCEEHKEKSHVIAQNVIQHPVFKEADTLLLYASFRSEVDTTELFQAAKILGKKIYYPKVLGAEMEFYRVETEDDFENGCWGILEPKPVEDRRYVAEKEEKVCIIMPGAVFDANGNRIGYGRGYYDKFLEEIQSFHVCKVGIGFECQRISIDEFPVEEHDIGLDILITENNVYIME